MARTELRKALVTGGAGFIGSHIVDRLAAEGFDEVRILDDLSSGSKDNVNTGAVFTLGSVTDAETVARVVDGVDVVFHQAALRSVPRSVEHPLENDIVNVHGTLTMLSCARTAGVRRFVHASSSSVYGGADVVPTPEDTPTRPRSPYAVSKLAGELYCRVFAELYGMEVVALRYFNVFGPRQDPGSAYAAVIPLFIDALSRGRAPLVHGDGLQSRDFTYIDDAVSANILAARADGAVCDGRAFNIARGETHTLVETLDVLQGILGTAIDAEFGEPRAGDLRRSHADITAARTLLGFEPSTPFAEGLERTVRSLAG